MRRVHLLVLLFAPCATMHAQTRPAASRAPGRWAHVTYLSGDLVYLDAGQVHGLAERSIGTVVRGDSAVGRLQVRFISSSRAAASLIEGGPVQVGDSALFEAHRVSPGPDSATSIVAAPGTSVIRRSQPRAISGRLGVRYLYLQTGRGPNGRVTQPAADIRLEGHALAGTGLGLQVDARAHRQRTTGGAPTTSTRIYQALVEYRPSPKSAQRYAVGRQMAMVLPSLGYFDGVTADVDREHWRVGLLAGTQPDFSTFAPSAATREAGGWLQWHTPPGRPGLLHLTMGGVGSYAVGGIDREYLHLSALYVSPVLSLYAVQEVDVNRAWKRTAEGGRALVPTSTFANVRWSPVPALAVHGGVDGRRSVRLYRDFLTPDVAFDDAMRRGMWAGVSAYAPHLQVNLDSRISDGETVSRSTVHSAVVSVNRITAARLGVRTRVSRYAGVGYEGMLQSVSGEMTLFERVRLEGTAGRRNDRRTTAEGTTAFGESWVGLDTDMSLARSLYLMASLYSEVGGPGTLRQGHVALAWRF